MARAKIEFHQDGIEALLKDREITSLLKKQGDKVKAYAIATAQEAQNGPDGTLFGYAEAGFTSELDKRGKRPRVVVKANDTSGMQWRVHFSTIKRLGMAHMRRALYSITSRK